MPGPYRAAVSGCPEGLALAGWPVGAAYMPPGTFAATGAPRAAYMRPLQTVPKNGVCGWPVGEAFMPPGPPCAATNTPGGINPSPTHCPQTIFCLAGRRGRRPLRRLARKRLPAATPRAGHCGVVSVGPRLSGAKPGANNRTSGPALLAGGARCAPPSARPLQRAAKPPPFLFVPPGTNATIFIISYLLFAPFVV